MELVTVFAGMAGIALFGAGTCAAMDIWTRFKRGSLAVSLTLSNYSGSFFWTSLGFGVLALVAVMFV